MIFGPSIASKGRFLPRSMFWHHSRITDASVGAALTGTTYKDINVSNGTTYYYVVSASNGNCSSDTSVEVAA